MVLTCMMPFLLTVMHLIMVSYLDWSYSSQDANYIDFSNGDDVCQVYSWYIGLPCIFLPVKMGLVCGNVSAVPLIVAFSGHFVWCDL